MSVRLTNDMREAIACKAMENVNSDIQKRWNALQKEENDIGMACYNAVFDKLTILRAKKMPKGWITQDACLIFNCSGYRLRLTVKKAVPVPSEHRYGCSELGIVKGEVGDRAVKWSQERERLKEEQREVKSKIMGLLQSVNTIPQLKAVWPDGEKFYKDYHNPNPAAKVPVAFVNEINQAIGLTKKELKNA